MATLMRDSYNQGSQDQTPNSQTPGGSQRESEIHYPHYQNPQYQHQPVNILPNAPLTTVNPIHYSSAQPIQYSNVYAQGAPVTRTSTTVGYQRPSQYQSVVHQQ